MLTVQSDALVPAETIAQLQSIAAASSRLHLPILQHGCLSSEIPPLPNLSAGTRAPTCLSHYSLDPNPSQKEGRRTLKQTHPENPVKKQAL